LIFSINSNAQSNTIETSGDILQIVLPSVAFGSTLIYKDGTKPAWQFAKTYGSTFLVTHGLKRLIDKKRPNGGHHAFPSGHTSSAFAGAAFLQKRYGWKIGAPAYLLASYTGWTRIDSKQHDTWDVLGGALVGTLSAYIFTEAYHSNQLELSFGRSDESMLLVLRCKF
jgi:membrane-associated phospholipid phosphatase